MIVAIVAWSIYTKVSTGSGLPPGPSGLLGAVEGITYLSLLAGESTGSAVQRSAAAQGRAGGLCVSVALRRVEMCCAAWEGRGAGAGVGGGGDVACVRRLVSGSGKGGGRGLRRRGEEQSRACKSGGAV